jgi:hypothetical protein
MPKTVRSASRFLTPLILLIALLLVACDDDDSSDASEAGTATSAPGATLIYREVQCLGNPWEGDWVASNPGRQLPDDEPARRAIFESYWRRQGIDVTNISRRRSPGGEVVCLGCNCPTGFEWAVQVPPNQVSAALARGFRQPT